MPLVPSARTTSRMSAVLLARLSCCVHYSYDTSILLYYVTRNGLNHALRKCKMFTTDSIVFILYNTWSKGVRRSFSVIRSMILYVRTTSRISSVLFSGRILRCVIRVRRVSNWWYWIQRSTAQMFTDSTVFSLYTWSKGARRSCTTSAQQAQSVRYIFGSTVALCTAEH